MEPSARPSAAKFGCLTRGMNWDGTRAVFCAYYGWHPGGSRASGGAQLSTLQSAQKFDQQLIHFLRAFLLGPMAHTGNDHLLLQIGRGRGRHLKHARVHLTYAVLRAG